MANHENLVIEEDQTFSSRIGRVLFFDFEDNLNVKLSIGDTIKKGDEILSIKDMGGVRALRNGEVRKAYIAIRVEKI